MHKNTAALTAVLFVLALLLIIINSSKPQTELATKNPPVQTPVPSPIAIPDLHYEDAACGVQLRYPQNITVTESTNSGTVFLDLQKPEHAVILLCTDSSLYSLPEYTFVKETIITAASGSATASARLYRSKDPANGTTQETLTFTHPQNGMDIFLSGFGDVFERMRASLKIK